MKALNSVVKKLWNAALAPLADWENIRVADKGWEREFEDLLPLPDGQMLVTLLDGRVLHHTSEGRANSTNEAAIEALMVLVQQRGPTMMARIDNEGVEPSCRTGLSSIAKRHTLGKRKLKRDQ
jgi:hypothetical protein